MKIPVLLFLVLTIASAVRADVDIEWINSAEAYFATSRERVEWFRLSDSSQREAFQRRYWLMRDPSPGTERNEFREVIADRIAKADRKFTITDGLRGSLTAQGTLYVTFGPPSKMKTNYRTDPDDIASEGTQQEVTWTYDTLRTPRLLQMLDRPALEIVVMIEPFRRFDAIQTPGLVTHYREVLAEKSVVNPQYDVPIIALPLEVSVAGLDAHIPDRARTALRSPGRTDGAAILSAMDVATAGGQTAVVIISVPNAGDRTAHLTTYAEVRSGDHVVATVAEPFRTTGIDAAPGSRSTVLQLGIPPGSYDASFAVIDDLTGETVLATATPLRVSDPSAGFALSSIILSGPPTQGDNAIFTFGKSALHPRADLRFRSTESLYFFATLRSSGAIDSVKAELQLRHDGKTIAASTFRPEVDQIAPGTYLLGRVLPLTGFGPGSYTLYLTVRRDEQESQVRRADFEIIR